MAEYDWDLTSEDFERARLLHEKEKLLTLDERSMFSAGLYCILSVAENYKKHKSMYDKLQEESLNTPENIIRDEGRLEEIIKGARFPKQKLSRIKRFAEWWVWSDVPERILYDISHGRKEEFDLRNRIAKEAPGIGMKGASLFMIKCGYENVVPLDIWILRFLESEGYDVIVPDYNKKSGPSFRAYLQYESFFIDVARKHGVTPALLQFALWSKYSTWNETKLF